MSANNAAENRPTIKWPDRWQRAVVRHDAGVTEVRFHSNGGPLVWDAIAHRELVEIFQTVGSDPDTKVVILTGTGEVFCTEIDLASFKTDPPSWENFWWEGGKLLTSLVGIDVPVIAAVNGPVSMHAEIPALGDITLATPEATFSDRAHTFRGSVPGDGVHLVWPALLGPSRGKYFLLTGCEIGAEEALRLGFVHEIHPAAALEAEAWRHARTLADKMSRATLRYTRAALSIEIRRHFAEGLSHGLALQGLGNYGMGGIKVPE